MVPFALIRRTLLVLLWPILVLWAYNTLNPIGVLHIPVTLASWTAAIVVFLTLLIFKPTVTVKTGRRRVS